jgi:acyl-CoA thioesterase FadM
MEYKAPALYDDTLDIEVTVKEFTLYRIIFVYKISNQAGRLLAKAETDLVCVGKDLRLVEVPEEVKKVLEAEAR